MQADAVSALTENVVELVRQEVPRVATSGRNWKLIFNGSAAGDVRMIVEEHAEIKRCARPLQVNS